MAQHIQFINYQWIT